MSRIYRTLVMTVAAVVLLFAADGLLQPVPLTAATAVLGGLIPLSLGCSCRLTRVGLGVVLDLLAGSAAHLYVHWSGRSPSPEEGLVAHLGVDAAVGLGVALVTVLVLMLAFQAAGFDSLSRPTGRPRT